MPSPVKEFCARLPGHHGLCNRVCQQICTTIGSEILQVWHSKCLHADEFRPPKPSLQRLSSSVWWCSQAILASQQGVVVLMDLLNDTEAIRNEALLLLTALAVTSREIQKIAAFEGAFQRLFGIVR